MPATQTAAAHSPARYSQKASMNTVFCPIAGMQAPSAAEYSQKCTLPPPLRNAQQVACSQKYKTRGQKAAHHHSFSQVIPCRDSAEPQGGEQVPSQRTPQDARSPRRTKCAARASCMSEDALGGNLFSARTCPPRAVKQVTRRCKPSRAYPQRHQTGCRSGSRGAFSSRGRSRCSQPGRSRSRRRHRPCCRSRRPGR